MRRMLLTIKGNSEEGYLAARNRGCENVEFIRTVDKVVLFRADCDEDIIVRWFTEDMGTFPCPAGSLLLYR